MTRTPCRFPEGPILREPADLDVEHLACEEVVHVAGARVVVAEYDVLQHDFPELRTDALAREHPRLRALPAAEREAAVRALIDDWLIANAAFVSTAQAAQAVVNSPIATDGGRGLAYRPPKYGRAFVVPTPTNAGAASPGDPSARTACTGLLDLKGGGVSPDRIPSSRPQSSGLEHLGTALSDFLVKKALDAIFAHALPTVWTVPVYAVLDLGFDVHGGELEHGPAGLHVRRAHRRRLVDQPSQVEDAATFAIESVLRRYGVTAATIGLQLHFARTDGRVTKQRGRARAMPVTDPAEIGFILALLRETETLTLERRDIQLTREVHWPPAHAQLVDFGAIRFVQAFERPLIRYYGGPTVEEIVWPGDPRFVQPDARLQFPVETWERRALAMHCLDLARAFRRQELSADDVRRDLDDRLLAWMDQWSCVSEVAGSHTSLEMIPPARITPDELNVPNSLPVNSLSDPA